MASASITFVLNRLGELAAKEAALLRGVDDDIRLLRDKLEWLQTFIQEADQERRKGANQYVGLWVRQTRDVAYQVEDVLDEFLRRVDLDSLGLPAWRRFFKLATSCTTQVSVRHVLKDSMDTIKIRLKEISDNVDKYRINKLHPGKRGSSSSSTAATSSISNVAAWYADEETTMVGSKDKCEDLENKLILGDSRRTVISIVGESGIGKSTLAWTVYDSHAIMEHFDVRAWINVPPQIRDDDILYFIYNALCPEADYEKSSATKKVHEGLLQCLQGKRYLVMVDGLVNFTNWNSILDSLPDKGNGSRVMVITRLEEKEAGYADPKAKVHPLKISNLNKEDSINLFSRKVFGAKGQFRNKIFGRKDLPEVEYGKTIENVFKDMFDITQGLPLALHNKIFGRKASSEVEYGKTIDNLFKDMFDITQGLPLAIVVLAGLLRSKNIQEWDKVFCQLKLSDEPKRVKRILALSFDDLPSRLKSCFLYFAGMAENLIINARRLVRLWVAEGFLKPKKGKTMEDIGQNYLKELISRGMIHLVKKDINGGVWLVAIHDRLHAFAESEAQEASFLEVHDNVDILAPASVRRLYLQNYMQSYIPINTSFPKLRSILCDFAEERSHNLEKPLPKSRIFGGGSFKNKANSDDLRYHALHFLPASKFLRVVDLRGLRIRKVPHAVGDMVHVRYLGLRSRSLTELPSSIARLINLQTLDIKRTEVEKVTEAFWEIPTLRHVVADKLRLPRSTGVLNNMQTLTGMVCSDPLGIGNNPLDNMVYLRYLEISGLTKQHWEGLASAFKKLESLLYLHLAGDDGIPFEMFTRFTLRRLQTLELFGRIDTSNASVEERYTLPNLTRLILKLSMVDQVFMDKIGELPSLMELVLSDNAYDGDALLFSDSGFNNVTNLVMANLPELSEWKIRPGSIPKIKRIALSGCPKMKIKLEGEGGEEGEKGLMEELKEVLVCNMDLENLRIEPANSVFSKKINLATIKSQSEDITDAMQRDGRWRSSMVACNMYHH